jgi:hypothetical protein
MGSVAYDHLVTTDDDDFHPVPPDLWWWHETVWFWFYAPERKLGGWLYNYVRPNIGVAGGGCFLWDDTTHFHMEVPYYASYNALELPRDRDLRDFTFPSGTAVTVLEPLRRYRLTHRDREWIDVRLEWEAIMDPFVSVGDDSLAARHFDQFGRIYGTIVLHGESIDIDCLAIRDRTWSPRSERWKDGGGYGYTNGAASAELSFLHNGFLVLDGVRRDLRSERTLERDPQRGFITRLWVVGEDSDGNELEAVGEPVSRMAIPIPGVHAVVWTSLVAWMINGIPAWGEDQEPWPLVRWAEFRRTGKMPAGSGYRS